MSEEDKGEKVLWVKAVHMTGPEIQDAFDRIQALNLPWKVIVTEGNLTLVGREELLAELKELVKVLEKNSQETKKVGGYVS